MGSESQEIQPPEPGTKPDRPSRKTAEPVRSEPPLEIEITVETSNENREGINRLFEDFFARGRIRAELSGQAELAEAWQNRSDAAAARKRIRERLGAPVRPGGRIELIAKLNPDHAKLTQAKRDELGKNKSYFVVLGNGRAAVEKPAATESQEMRGYGSMPNERQMDRELIVESMADLLGAYVPAMIEVETPDGPAARIDWIEMDEPKNVAWKSLVSPSDIESAAVLDAAFENMDRHDGNFGINRENRIVCFDHGLCLTARDDAWQRSPFLSAMTREKMQEFMLGLDVFETYEASRLATRTMTARRNLSGGEDAFRTFDRPKLSPTLEAVLSAFLEPSRENQPLHDAIEDEFTARFGLLEGTQRWRTVKRNLAEIVDSGLPPHLEPRMA